MRSVYRNYAGSPKLSGLLYFGSGVSETALSNEINFEMEALPVTLEIDPSSLLWIGHSICYQGLEIIDGFLEIYCLYNLDIRYTI